MILINYGSGTQILKKFILCNQSGANALFIICPTKQRLGSLYLADQNKTHQTAIEKKMIEQPINL